jgi:hypothetical protein
MLRQGGDANVPAAAQRLVITLTGDLNPNITETLLANVRVVVHGAPPPDAPPDWTGILDSRGVRCLAYVSSAGHTFPPPPRPPHSLARPAHSRARAHATAAPA